MVQEAHEADRASYSHTETRYHVILVASHTLNQRPVSDSGSCAQIPPADVLTILFYRTELVGLKAIEF